MVLMSDRGCEVMRRKFKACIFNMPSSQIGLSFLSMLAFFAWLWLTRGNHLGSVAGGLFFGLLINPQPFLEIKRPWIKESAFSVGAVAMVVLDGVKGRVLMPRGWEATPVQFAVGFIGLLIAVAIATIMDWARTPQNVLDAMSAKRQEEQQDMLQDGAELT